MYYRFVVKTESTHNTIHKFLSEINNAIIVLTAWKWLIGYSRLDSVFTIREINTAFERLTRLVSLIVGWFFLPHYFLAGSSFYIIMCCPPSPAGTAAVDSKQLVPRAAAPPPVKVRMIWITFCLLRLPPTVSWLDDPLFYVWVKYESALIAAVVLD